MADVHRVRTLHEQLQVVDALEELLLYLPHSHPPNPITKPGEVLEAELHVLAVTAGTILQRREGPGWEGSTFYSMTAQPDACSTRAVRLQGATGIKVHIHECAA